jgi:hypothetical protein
MFVSFQMWMGGSARKWVSIEFGKAQKSILSNVDGRFCPEMG